MEVVRETGLTFSYSLSTVFVYQVLFYTLPGIIYYRRPAQVSSFPGDSLTCFIIPFITQYYSGERWEESPLCDPGRI